jgi:hypothetical protein
MHTIQWILPLLLSIPVQAVDWNESLYPPAKSNKDGDYFGNVSYTLGRVSNKKLQPGHLWQVVVTRLNCRSQPDRQAAIVRQFQQGTVLQADVGRGGSDEVLQNATDSVGKPWMRVRSADGEAYDCYVRANQAYLRPK